MRGRARLAYGDFRCLAPRISSARTLKTVPVRFSLRIVLTFPNNVRFRHFQKRARITMQSLLHRGGAVRDAYATKKKCSWSRIVQIPRLVGQPAQRRLGVADRRSDRLIDLMGDRSHEVPHGLDAAPVRQLPLDFAVSLTDEVYQFLRTNPHHLGGELDAAKRMVVLPEII